MKITGLMGAMPEEMVRIVAMMEQRTERTIGNRTYHEGLIDGMPVVAVFSRWGKVAAATTATTLIEIFGVEQLIFTGIAGALAPCLSVGDVVVADCLVQHDMDARPLMSRYEVPLTGKQFFETDVLLSKAVEQAAANMLLNEEAFLLLSGEDGLQKPSVIRGVVASGDQFISSTSVKEEILAGLPSVLCVEMEGAAVAQVCHDFTVPLSVVRVISDTADESSHELAIRFVDRYAAGYLELIVKHLLPLLRT